MTALTLEQHNRPQILDMLHDDVWVVACLCAAWCDVCKTYRPLFDTFAARHPDKQFLWIDVEDQADLVGDFEIDNFPTLLLQRGDYVTFFGPVQPDIHIAMRLLSAHAEKSLEELAQETATSAQRHAWQEENNLRRRLQSA